MASRNRLFVLPFDGSSILRIECVMGSEEPQLPITSSVEPAWAIEARDCYEGVIRTLQKADVRFAVSGGFAFHHHTGIWRATKDLDLVLTPASAKHALAVLRQVGFETWIQDRVWLAKARRGDFYVDLITGAGNATLTVTPAWIERARENEVLGMHCRVLGAEEMIASKIFVTRRERFDGADIAHLLKACGPRLDWPLLMSLAGDHWQMLYWQLVLFAYAYPAHAGIVPREIWSDLSDRFRATVLAPSHEPSRGSLIDPKMFAIDVDEWGEPNLYRELWDHYPEPITCEEERETQS
jgi:hypothetical protein